MLVVHSGRRDCRFTLGRYSPMMGGLDPSWSDASLPPAPVVASRELGTFARVSTATVAPVVTLPPVLLMELRHEQ